MLVLAIKLYCSSFLLLLLFTPSGLGLICYQDMRIVTGLQPTCLDQPGASSRLLGFLSVSRNILAKQVKSSCQLSNILLA